MEAPAQSSHPTKQKQLRLFLLGLAARVQDALERKAVEALERKAVETPAQSSQPTKQKQLPFFLPSAKKLHLWTTQKRNAVKVPSLRVRAATSKVSHQPFDCDMEQTRKPGPKTTETDLYIYVLERPSHPDH